MTVTDMQRLQEMGHGPSHDYRAGSPHLKHWQLSDRFTRMLRDAIAAVGQRSLPLTVLEVGAGHGGYTEPALAAGCRVTATETSRPAVDRLVARFRWNPGFRAIFSPDGSLEGLGTETFSLIVCASVLHHIPDYVAFVDDALTHLAPGGVFVSVADPLWYPRLRTADHVASRTAYFAWRATRGRYRDGLKTRIRRLRGVYDADNPADMVEYHVNRNGVDELALEALLAPRFATVSLLPYWSTQASLMQRMGERVGVRNCFAVLADDFVA